MSFKFSQNQQVRIECARVPKFHGRLGTVTNVYPSYALGQTSYRVDFPDGNYCFAAEIHLRDATVVWETQ